MYFRSLVEPVFTYSLYPALLATARRPPGEHPRHLQQLLQLLPRHNLLTLRTLCRHLHHLARHHEVNSCIIFYNDSKNIWSGDGHDLPQPRHRLGA